MADQLIGSIDVPRLGELLLANAGRAHNRIARDALRRVLLTHATRRVPLHFTRPAHQRYGYAQRSASYRHYKQRRYHSSTDLIETGRTRDAMSTRREITIGGTAASGNLRGDLKLKFPFGAQAQQAWARRKRGQARGAPLAARGRKDGRPRITIDQMRREIAAIVPSEISEINAQLRDLYVDGVHTTTGSRQRVPI